MDTKIAKEVNNGRSEGILSTSFAFIKKNAVMFIALLAAAITSFIIPPDAAYLDYFD